jgi:hypothetical protein
MKSLRILGICVGLLIVTLPSNAHAIGPQLQVDCGNWTYLKDARGSYRELSAVALYTFAGDSFKYKISFYGSSKEKFSRGIFQGTYEIEDPEYTSRTIEMPLNMKFRNNKLGSFMYKTKYIKADIKFTDVQGFENYQTCIWKWS